MTVPKGTPIMMVTDMTQEVQEATREVREEREAKRRQEPIPQWEQKLTPEQRAQISEERMEVLRTKYENMVGTQFGGLEYMEVDQETATAALQAA